MSWWRRNRFTLPVMVLALGAVAWPLSEPARDVWWARQPHVAASPDGEGWATIEGFKARLAAFDEVSDLPDDEVPQGLKVWRAEIAASAEGGGADEPLQCGVELADTEGKTYSAGSSYVPSFDDDTFGANCGGGDEPGGVVYFLLPADAEPDHLVLTASDYLPNFWHLPVP